MQYSCFLNTAHAQTCARVHTHPQTYAQSRMIHNRNTYTVATDIHDRNTFAVAMNIHNHTNWRTFKLYIAYLLCFCMSIATTFVLRLCIIIDTYTHKWTTNIICVRGLVIFLQMAFHKIIQFCRYKLVFLNNIINWITFLYVLRVTRGWLYLILDYYHWRHPHNMKLH